MTKDDIKFYRLLGKEFSNLVEAQYFAKNFMKDQKFNGMSFTMRAMSYHISYALELIEGLISEKDELAGSYAFTKYGPEIFSHMCNYI